MWKLAPESMNRTLQNSEMIVRLDDVCNFALNAIRLTVLRHVTHLLTTIALPVER